jgi:tetratricopeptide (TPR) repeat protein
MKKRTIIIGLTLLAALVFSQCRNPNLTGGILYIQQDNYKKAAETLAIAVEEEPDNALAHYYYAISLGKTDKCELSGEAFDKAAKLDTALLDSINANRYRIWAEHYNRGVQNYQMRLFDEATDKFHCALGIDSGQVNTYINLGLTYSKDDKLEEAEKIFKKGLKVSPESSDLLLSLGDVYLLSGRNEEALPIYKKLSNIRKEDSEVYMRLGAIYDELGKTEKAIEAYEKTLELDPENEKVYMLLGIDYAQAGDDQKARKMFEKAIEFDPDNADLHFNLGVIYGRLKMTKEAERELKKAEDLE